MPRYAAIDIGSNSLRMLAADVTPGGDVRPLATDRRITRLGESVFRTGRLSETAIQDTCQVLASMAEQVRRAEVAGLRVVATSAVRDASNQAEFLARTSAAVGAPVEIISGGEEARLIHLGVMARWPQPDKRVLLIDVGGGSAEFIVSHAGQMREGVSKPLGAVRLKEVFLAHDPPLPVELGRLENFIEEKLSDSVRRIGAEHSDLVIATSASAGAIVCEVNGIPAARRDEADRVKATQNQIQRLYEELRALPLALRKRRIGIGPRRAEIIVPGAAVLAKALALFRLPALHYSTAGVREGIVADLAARNVGQELSSLAPERCRVVEALAARYEASLDNGRQVAHFARELFTVTRPLHQLAPAHGQLLEAAAWLHNIGHFVAPTAHHKHSFYLVANSELPGFTDEERQLLALLCRYHRKAMPGPRHEAFVALSSERRQVLLLLIPLLRLALAFDQSRDQRVQRVRHELRNGQLLLSLEARANTDLEQWAAERAGEQFEAVYGKRVLVARVG